MISTRPRPLGPHVRTLIVKSVTAAGIVGGALALGAATASAQQAPYPPVTTTPGVDSTVDVEGAVVTRSDSGIAVGSTVGRGGPAATGTTAFSGGPVEDDLADTGATVLPLTAAGGALVLVGGAAVLVSRKRRA